MSRPRSFYLLVGGAVLLVLIVGAFALNQELTRIVESDSTRAMLEKETAKGMHFTSAHYAPLTRVGLLGIKGDSGSGEKGLKTIVSLNGTHVTGAFNPLGIFLKRWQVEFLHFDTGTVWLQKTEGTPNAKKPPGPPWYLFFWPDHVYLKDIKCDDGKVLFKLQNKESGIYDTFLDITPNGRDFEYDAKGGVFSTPMTPKLNVEHIHLLVRKPRLYCQTMVLGDDLAHPEHQMRVTGEAGLQQDRGIKVKADIDSLNVSRWVPATMRTHILGKMNGHLEYSSTGTGMETAKVDGNIAIVDGVIHELKAFKLYTDATKSPGVSDLPLKSCQLNVKMDQGAMTARDIQIESEGVFRVEGTVTMAKDKTLSGELQIGLTSTYLKWLPTAETSIFTRTVGAYHFATVHVSGTSKKPQQDLSARLIKEIGDHPFVAVKLFFNSSTDWLNFN